MNKLIFKTKLTHSIKIIKYPNAAYHFVPSYYSCGTLSYFVHGHLAALKELAKIVYSTSYIAYLKQEYTLNKWRNS